MQFIFKKSFLISGSVLILAAVIYAAQWKWHFWHDAQSHQPVIENSIVQMQNPEPNEPVVSPDNNSIREILSANLFGAEGVAKTASAEAVPKTVQPLELHGIVFIPHHPQQSVALIAQAGQLGKDYKKGDEISAGITVAEILPDLVFIDNQGTREKLELAKPDFNPANTPQPATNPAVPFDNAIPPQDSGQPIPDNQPVPENIPVAENLPPQGNDPQPAPNEQPPDNIQPSPANPIE